MIIRLAISWGGGIGGVPLGSHDKNFKGQGGCTPKQRGPHGIYCVQPRDYLTHKYPRVIGLFFRDFP